MRKLISFTIDEKVIQILREHTDKTDIPASRFVEKLLRTELKIKKESRKYKCHK